MKVTSKPTIRFSAKAWQQMWALTDAHDEEISAIGVIADKEELVRDGIKEAYYIKEFYVPRQECSAVTTVMDDDSVLEIMMDLREKGVKAVNVCVWWHSHVNMGTAHSGTDENQIERFDFDEACISIITNKKNEINLRVDMYKPFRYSFEKCNYVVDQVSVLPSGWAEERIEECVRKKRVIPEKLNIKKSYNGTKGSYSSYGYYNNAKGWGSVMGAEDPFYYDENPSYGSITTKVEEDEEEGVNYSVQEVIEALDFPEELSGLQSAYDTEQVGANEAMRYYAQWYAKEMSTEELEKDLFFVHGIEVVEEEEVPEDPSNEVIDVSEELLVVGGAK